MLCVLLDIGNPSYSKCVRKVCLNLGLLAGGALLARSLQGIFFYLFFFVLFFVLFFVFWMCRNTIPSTNGQQPKEYYLLLLLLSTVSVVIEWGNLMIRPFLWQLNWPYPTMKEPVAMMTTKVTTFRDDLRESGNNETQTTLKTTNITLQMN